MAGGMAREGAAGGAGSAGGPGGAGGAGRAGGAALLGFQEAALAGLLCGDDDAGGGGVFGESSGLLVLGPGLGLPTLAAGLAREHLLTHTRAPGRGGTGRALPPEGSSRCFLGARVRARVRARARRRAPQRPRRKLVQRLRGERLWRSRRIRAGGARRAP